MGKENAITDSGRDLRVDEGGSEGPAEVAPMVPVSGKEAMPSERGR